MNHDSFMAYGERCRKVWLEFKRSFQDPGLKSFLKHTYPVLSCVNGQIPLDSLDICSVAIGSPDSFVANEASQHLIEHVKLLEELKKDARDKDKQSRIEKWLREFDPQRLEFKEHRLEVRFQSLKMNFIQEIKESRFVDPSLTNMALASIRIVLKVSAAGFLKEGLEVE